MELPRDFADWREALTQLLGSRASAPWAEWELLGNPHWELAAWDDPRHQQGTCVPADSPTSYVERTVSVLWGRGIVHCCQYDTGRRQ